MTDPEPTIDDLQKMIRKLQHLLRHKDAALKAIAWKCHEEDQIEKDAWK